MILCTIQTPPAWRSLRTTGVLRADSHRIEPNFLPAYRWMAKQLVHRVGPPPSGVRYPIWAWQRPKPDLRRSGHLPHNLPGVLIQFAATPDSVLLSDFHGWHCVLNRWHLPRTQDAERAFLARVRRSGVNEQHAWSLPWARASITRSWEKIFDLTWSNPDWVPQPQEKAVQACIWQIDRSQVRTVQSFVAR